MTLTEFLHERIVEEETVEVTAQADLCELPVDVYETTTAAAMLHLNYAFRRLGWALATIPPWSWLGFGSLARAKAGEYAGHHDFDEAWRL